MKSHATTGLEESTAAGVSRTRLGRIEFTSGDRAAALSLVGDWFAARSRGGLLIGFINPHVYNAAVAEPVVADFLRQCDFVCVDGVGITVAARLLEGRQLPRLIATDLFEALIPGGVEPLDALLIGTSAAEATAAAAAINARAGGLHVVDAMDGFRDLSRYEALFAQHADVDAVLVGAGSPKSEEILLRAQQTCRRALALHIGAGTIKIYAGTKRRAPRFVSRCGLEWMHRMLFEPHTRRRYTTGAWAFAGDLVRSRSQRRES